MPLFDFRCSECQYQFEKLVPVGTKQATCNRCQGLSEQVWLSAPKLDWSGMAQGPNAGPEFIDRFERSHKERKAKEEAHKQEHGDALRGAGG